MGIVFWIAFGILAGSLTKLVMPGPNLGGLAVAITVGIAGAFAGGLIGVPLGIGSVTDFDVRNLLMAFTGPLLLLFLYRSFAMRRDVISTPLTQIEGWCVFTSP